MSKFNVGDRVRILHSSYRHLIPECSIQIIQEVESEKGYVLIQDLCFYFTEIELVEPTLTIDKVTEWLSDNNYFFEITKGGYIASSNYDGYKVITTDELVEPEFQWGEEVEVRDEATWKSATYLCMIPENFWAKDLCMIPENFWAKDSHLCLMDDDFFPFYRDEIRKPKTKVTLNEIAEWKGVDKDRIKIDG